MSLVFRSPVPTNAAQRLVLLALADFANENGVCWPSIRVLADRTRMSERGVQKAVRSLEAGNLLAIRTGGFGREGGRYANTYTLTLKGEPCAPTPEHHSGVRVNTVHPTPEQDAWGRVNTETPTPEYRAPQPSGTIMKNPQGTPTLAGSGYPDLGTWLAYAKEFAPDWPQDDAQSSFDHYVACGWRMGEGRGKPVVDWRACVRTCARRWQKNSGGAVARAGDNPNKGLEIFEPVGGAQ